MGGEIIRLDVLEKAMKRREVNSDDILIITPSNWKDGGTFTLECCDCSLVHDFKITPKGIDKIHIQIIRNEIKTGIARKKLK